MTAHAAATRWYRLRKTVISPVLAHLVMLATVVVILFPVLYSFVLSTQTPAEYYQFPPRLVPGTSLVENVSVVWNRVNMGRLLLNTT
jgi:ABC-type glycerol-3-phosphate transport system permease component